MCQEFYLGRCRVWSRSGNVAEIGIRKLIVAVFNRMFDFQCSIFAFSEKVQAMGIEPLFGPVMNPKEICGLGAVKVDSEDEVKQLIEKKSGIYI